MMRNCGKGNENKEDVEVGPKEEKSEGVKPPGLVLRLEDARDAVRECSWGVLLNRAILGEEGRPV